MLFIRRKKPTISVEQIDEDAVRVLTRLNSAGNLAYLVGGSVRDLLLGRRPKDFDIGTDARPNEIRRMFRNCFLVGRRFRLAHIVYGKKVIETATFRRQPEEAPEKKEEDGLYQHEDNTFGSPEEDAIRRDFTVNGLFYDLQSNQVIDYVKGLKDLEKKTIRSIGDPNVRFREDPVRMMRAVRFAAKLGFRISSSDKKAMVSHHADIKNASLSRLCEEIFRLFVDGATEQSMRLLHEHHLMADLLPDVAAHIRATGGEKSDVWVYLAAMDKLTEKDSDITNAVRLATLYYPLFKAAVKKVAGDKPRFNRKALATQVLQQAARHYRMPKAAWLGAVMLHEVLPRFEEAAGDKSRHARFVLHPIFKEALLFATIVRKAEGIDTKPLAAWQDLQVKQHALRADRIATGEASPAEASQPHARRRRSRRRRPVPGGHQGAPRPDQHPPKGPGAPA